MISCTSLDAVGQTDAHAAFLTLNGGIIDLRDVHRWAAQSKRWNFTTTIHKNPCGETRHAILNPDPTSAAGGV